MPDYGPCTGLMVRREVREIKEMDRKPRRKKDTAKWNIFADSVRNEI